MKEISGGEASNPVNCFKCGKLGHRANECKSAGLKCFKCGKTGYHIVKCMSNVSTCYNCGKLGHISTQCQKPKKTPTIDAQTNGRVFTLNGVDVSKLDNLIRGICFIHNVTLISMIDTGATHSFISLECVSKLKLEVSSMNGSRVIDT